jgi:hypothetical protein
MAARALVISKMAGLKKVASETMGTVKLKVTSRYKYPGCDITGGVVRI